MTTATSPDSDNAARLARPIIVLGSPRSGTTILSQLLRRHRDLALAEEPRMIWRFGNDHRSDLLPADAARPEVIAHIRRQFADLVTEQGKTRLLEKTPANALRPEFVHRIFPDARFIHIMRHGVDATLSIQRYWQDFAHGTGGQVRRRMWSRLKELRPRRVPHYAREVLRRFAPHWLSPVVGQPVWGPRLPGMDQMLREMDLIEVCALQWRMCVELTAHYGRTLDSTQYLELRLEKMTPETFDRIFAFCELDDDPAVREGFTEKFQPDMAGARQRDADPVQVEKVRRWVNPTLQWLGYDT